MTLADNYIARWMGLEVDTPVKHTRSNDRGVIIGFNNDGSYAQTAQVVWLATGATFVNVPITHLYPVDVAEERDEVWARYVAWRLSQ